jgi:type IV pilus assembly protein PilM
MHMLHTRRRHSFTMPELLIVRSVGLDISDQSVKYAELVPSRGSLVLGRHGALSFPEGVIVSGKVVDPAKLGTTLLALRTKEKIRAVRVSLPEEQVYVFRIRVTGVPYQNLRSAVELQLEEHIPIAVKDAVFDFDCVESHDDGFDVQVVATSKDILDGYLKALAIAELTPLSFELEAQALARAVTPSGDTSTSMVIDFGATRTGISIIHKGIVLFTSTIAVGGNGVTSAISRALSISFDEAEKMKHAIGLSEREQNREAFGAMVGTLSALRDEINRSYTYWHTEKNDEGNDRPRIESIVLSGGNANLPGLTEYLASSLRMPVATANPWVNITDFSEYIPAITKKEALAYATAIGLALKDVEYE